VLSWTTLSFYLPGRPPLPRGAKRVNGFKLSQPVGWSIHNRARLVNVSKRKRADNSHETTTTSQRRHNVR
jgi:hypothetical protein